MACGTDYSFYANVYRGEALSPQAFPRLAKRAGEYLAGKTRGLSLRPRTPEGKEAVGLAVCALAEAMGDEERMQKAAFSEEPALSSETVGSWSRTYQSAGVSAAAAEYLESRKREAVERYLSGVPEFAPLFGVRGYRWGRNR